MKSRATLLLAGLSAAALAGEGILGTRAGGGGMNPASGGGSPVGALPLLQMLIAVAIVFGLVKWALPKLLGKVNKKLVPELGSSIHIEESASFAGGSLFVVRARRKTLLLSVASTGVTCLADLGDSEVEDVPPPTFQEMVLAAPGTKASAVVEAPDNERVQDALERLSRFTN